MAINYVPLYSDPHSVIHIERLSFLPRFRTGSVYNYFTVELAEDRLPVLFDRSTQASTPINLFL
jgi:hypothetical protein